MTTYKVTGPAFQGHQPGETFEAELDPALEARAKERGQIRVLKRDEKDEPEKTTKKDKEDE
jgi:hypothetical protein